MCRRVGTTYDEIDFDANYWYVSCEWTEQEEIMFKKWLSDYIYNNTEARNELMDHPIKRKKYTDSFATWFVFQYGWKIVD